MRRPKPTGGRWAVLLGCWLLALCAAATAAAGGPAPAAVPDPIFDRLFVRTGGGWTGGDGTLSVALPDGRTVWLFGDSFLGTVDADGTRPADTPLVRNCLVVQDGERLVTRHGGTRQHPSAFFASPGAGEWYWPGDGTVADGRLFVFLHRYRQVRPGIWGWRWTGTAVARLRLPALRLEAIVSLGVKNGVRYGVALLEEAGDTLICGVETRSGQRRMHVARARAGDLLGAWRFYDGRNWSGDPAATASVLTGVSSQFGLARTAQGLVLVTMDARRPFNAELVLYRAAGVTGFWRGPCRLWTAPEADADVAAYSPFVHPQFTAGGRLLVSYNLNHVRDPGALYTDAALYRPRFVRVDPAGGFPVAPRRLPIQ